MAQAETKMNRTDSNIQKRKNDHLRIVREEQTAHTKGALFDCIHLVHNALPELALPFFGRVLNAPIMITAMTGGTPEGLETNRALADAAETYGIALGLGSQRAMLTDPSHLRYFQVRDRMPNSVLLGNIGAQQLRELSNHQILELVQSIDADGLCIHLNPAHEMAQADGDRDFSGLIHAIQRSVDCLGDRVIVKETGAGIAPDQLQMLADIGVKHVDLAGAGGTSWVRVEQYRAETPESAWIAETFGDWGIPTAAGLLAAAPLLEGRVAIIGSGGLRNGLDAAKAVACGAQIAGFAAPALQSIDTIGNFAPAEFVARIIHELRTAMLLTGSKTPGELRKTKKIITGELRNWVSGLGSRD